jgi:hypothetical protein
MQKTASTSITAKNLAILRLVVLKINELNQIGTTSKGLSPQGQADLSYIFPRTSALAAVNHASTVARLEHDDKVRSRGVYHLFRLPTYWEELIHRASLECQTHEIMTAAESIDSAAHLFLGLPDPVEPSPSPQGPVDLGVIDLTSSRHLANLVGQYFSALRSKHQVIPFFRIAE